MSKIVEQFPFMRDHLHKFAPALQADLLEVMTLAHEKGAHDAMDLLEPQWNTGVHQLPPACSGEFVNGEKTIFVTLSDEDVTVEVDPCP